MASAFGGQLFNRQAAISWGLASTLLNFENHPIALLHASKCSSFPGTGAVARDYQLVVAACLGVRFNFAAPTLPTILLESGLPDNPGCSRVARRQTCCDRWLRRVHANCVALMKTKKE